MSLAWLEPEGITRIGRIQYPHVDEYLAELRERLVRPATLNNTRRVLGLVDREVGLVDVSPIRLRDFFDERDLAVSTRYTYWTIVRLWSAWYRQDGPDPFRMAKRPPKYVSTPRPVTREQLRVILERVPERTRDMTILSAYAGLRVGELSQLEREDLRDGLLGKVVVVRSGKGGLPGEVPAHPLGVETIERYAPGRLFKARPASLSKIASRHYNEAGVDVSIHQMRHYYATSLYRSCRDVHVVQQGMRHSRLDTTSLYIKPDQESLFDAITTLDLPTTEW